jgi:ribonuclease VapC
VIVDTSVVIAIYDSEPDAHDLARRIRQAPERRMSAASFVEAGVVALRRERRIGLEAVRELVPRFP